MKEKVLAVAIAIQLIAFISFGAMTTDNTINNVDTNIEVAGLCG